MNCRPAQFRLLAVLATTMFLGGPQFHEVAAAGPLRRLLQNRRPRLGQVAYSGTVPPSEFTGSAILPAMAVPGMPMAASNFVGTFSNPLSNPSGSYGGNFASINGNKPNSNYTASPATSPSSTVPPSKYNTPYETNNMPSTSSSIDSNVYGVSYNGMSTPKATPIDSLVSGSATPFYPVDDGLSPFGSSAAPSLPPINVDTGTITVDSTRKTRAKVEVETGGRLHADTGLWTAPGVEFATATVVAFADRKGQIIWTRRGPMVRAEFDPFADPTTSSGQTGVQSQHWDASVPKSVVARVAHIIVVNTTVPDRVMRILSDHAEEPQYVGRVITGLGGVVQAR